MEFVVQIAAQQFEVLHAQARSIAIPLDFDGAQPNLFNVPPATRADLAMGDFVGNVRKGGGCNVDDVSLIPHCHGTHTESVGHILQQTDCVVLKVGVAPILAVLVSVTPEVCGSHLASYPAARESDRVITRESLQRAIGNLRDAKFSWNGIIIRTLPNLSEKLTSRYQSEPAPPYLTLDCVDYLAEVNVQHLLIDLPSIDRVFDGGRLLNHRHYWGVDEQRVSAARPNRTITEMVFVPDDVSDGLYLVELQVPHWELHALPSRPVLVPLRQKLPA